MAVAVLQLVFLLYMFVSVAECDALFKLVNSSVQMDIQNNNINKSFDLTWSFNSTNNIVKYNGHRPSRVLGDYKGRVEFNEETHSLTLKNIQKSDSGLYEAEASYEKDEIVAKYTLYVLDPVEKPVLNVSSQQSTGTCNVTLTCEAQKLSVTSHCYDDSCDIKESKTAGVAPSSLSLYVSKSLIICNHSNPVSWENATIEMKQLCSSKGDHTRDSVNTYIIIGIFFIIGICICSGIYFFYCRRRKIESVNTVYEEVDPLKKGGKKTESVKMSEMHPETPGTVYSTVGKPDEACSNDEGDVSTKNPNDKKMDTTEVSPVEPLYDSPDKNNGGENKYIPQTIYATVNKCPTPV